MRNTILIVRVGSLYDYTMHNLKMEQLNEGIINADLYNVRHHLDNFWLISKNVVWYECQDTGLKKILTKKIIEVFESRQRNLKNKFQHCIIRLEKKSLRFSNNQP